MPVDAERTASLPLSHQAHRAEVVRQGTESEKEMLNELRDNDAGERCQDDTASSFPARPVAGNSPSVRSSQSMEGGGRTIVDDDNAAYQALLPQSLSTELQSAVMQPQPPAIRIQGQLSGDKKPEAHDLDVQAHLDTVSADSAGAHPRDDSASPQVQPNSHTEAGFGPVAPLDENAVAIPHSPATRSQQDANIDDPSIQLRPQAASSGDAPQHEAKRDALGEDAMGAQPEQPSWARRDNVQLVEIRNPEGSGWSAMSKAVREYDVEEIEYYKDDIDTLLVFAGLYSAILSAFIIESYKFLQPDPDDRMAFLFQQMISQNYTISNGFMNATNPYPALPAFEAPTWAVRVNVLWFSSLVVSLAAASYGMLVKQWLREYLDLAGNTSPHERLRARQYRRPALEHWKVFEIAASLPLLLEIALGLFFVGLCYFTTSIHSSISRSTILLVAAWAFFFLFATIAPLVSPRCPFKTTLLRGSMRRLRKAVLLLAHACITAYAFAMKHVLTAYFACASAIRKGATSSRAYLRRVFQTSLIPRLLYRMQPPRVAPAGSPAALDRMGVEAGLPSIGGFSAQLDNATARSDYIATLRQRLEAHMEEETHALKEPQDDMEILQSVEDIMPGDGLLLTVVDIAAAAKPEWDDAFEFIRKIVYNRTGRAMDIGYDFPMVGGIDPSACIRSLEPLSQQACDALTTWVSNILLYNQSAIQPMGYEGYIRECCIVFYSLISSHYRSLPALHAQALHRLVFYLPAMIPPRLLNCTGFRYRLQQLFLIPEESSLVKWPSDVTFNTWASAIEVMFYRIGYNALRSMMLPAISLLMLAWQASSPSGRPRKGRSPQPLSQDLINLFLNYSSRDQYDLSNVNVRTQVLTFYSILLGSARSEKRSSDDDSRLFTRNLTAALGWDSTGMYHWYGFEEPSTPKMAFLSLMKSYSTTWVSTVLSWLAPGRMPGNILAEIVAADIASSEEEGQLRKLDQIIEICHIAALQFPATAPNSHEIDFSSLLQIVVLLERTHLFKLYADPSHPAVKKVSSVQDALRIAIQRRHAAYRIGLIAFSGVMRRPTSYSPELLEKHRSWLSSLVAQMRRERLDLVHSMGSGIYHGGSWAGVLNQALALQKGMRLVVGRDPESATDALRATSLALGARKGWAGDADKALDRGEGMRPAWWEDPGSDMLGPGGL